VTRESADRALPGAPRIKLCGVRRVADAVLCAEAGADEIGIVLAPASRRCISLAEARAIRAALPARTALVGVFRDPTLPELIDAARAVPLSAVQLHGDAPDLAALAALRLPIYRAIHVDGPAALDAHAGVAGAGGAGVGATGAVGTGAVGTGAVGTGAGAAVSGYARVLLDGPGGGGGGARFDWALARAARSRFSSPLFVAGGLTPENVAEAVRVSVADGVDVSSGIEGEDGFKDAVRVRAFLAAATAAFDSRREQDRWS
jgi:phosphoribosylanthranilate isomerase